MELVFFRAHRRAFGNLDARHLRIQPPHQAHDVRGLEGVEVDARAFVLIANTSSAAGRVRVTTLNENLAQPRPGEPFELDLPPNSRTTVPVMLDLSPSRFGVLVESIGPTPAPIVVEGAFLSLIHI